MTVDKGDNSKPKNGVNKRERRDRSIQHFSYQELMDRKQKGLSYKCGWVFHPLHQYPDRKLKLKVVNEEDSLGSEEDIKVLEAKD